MIQDYDGTNLVDSNGEKVGTIEQSYVDDTGRVLYVEVKTGMLFAKHHLVPAENLQESDSVLVAPYTREHIANSPDASDLDNELGGEILTHVRSYYTDRTDA